MLGLKVVKGPNAREGFLRKFVIFADQRTGSTWLADLLNSHPDIFCLQDILNFHFCDLRDHIPPLPNFKQEYIQTYPQFLDGYIWNGKNKKQKGRQVLAHGFKFLYVRMEGAYNNFIKYFENNQIAIIHLIRLNTLDAILSEKLNVELSARKYAPRGTGKPWYYPPMKVIIKPEEVTDKVQWLQKWYDMVASFPQHIPVIQITYEDLCADTAKELARICQFLEVPIVPLSSKKNKRRTGPQSDFILNYNKLKGSFVGSPYTWFFEN